MRTKKFIISFSLFMLFIICTPCYASSGKCSFTLDRTITNATTKFRVMYEYSTYPNDNPNYELDYEEQEFKDASLFVTVNGKVAFRQKLQQSVSCVTVNMKKPKVGDIIRISIKAPGWKSNAKKIVVKNITSIVPSKRSSRVKTPVVKLKRATNNIYAYHITAQKGQTVIVRDGDKILKKIKFTKNGTVVAPCILRNLFRSEVYVYSIEKGYRSSSYKLLPRTMNIPE